jgi:hypothetical protein
VCVSKPNLSHYMPRRRWGERRWSSYSYSLTVSVHRFPSSDSKSLSISVLCSYQLLGDKFVLVHPSSSAAGHQVFLIITSFLTHRAISHLQVQHACVAYYAHARLCHSVHNPTACSVTEGIQSFLASKTIITTKGEAIENLQCNNFLFYNH